MSAPEAFFLSVNQGLRRRFQHRLRESRKMCHEPRCGLAVGQCRLTSAESRSRGIAHLPTLIVPRRGVVLLLPSASFGFFLMLSTS